MNSKIYILSFFFVLINSVLTAQKKNDDCTYTYFSNKKVSTSQCMNPDGYSGKATAYNLKGEVIGEWHLSRMHQLSGVRFSFHPNGMVHKAEYSSHPDAGIQWYRSYTEYNDKGEKINFWEQSHDDRITFIAPHKENPIVRDTVIEEVFPQEVMACAVIYVSELWLDNRTKKDIRISWKHKYHSDEKSDAIIIIPRGERMKICERILAEQYEAPMNYYEIKVYNKRGKELRSVISPLPLISDVRIDEHRKGYVYDVK